MSSFCDLVGTPSRERPVGDAQLGALRLTLLTLLFLAIKQVGI